MAEPAATAMRPKASGRVSQIVVEWITVGLLVAAFGGFVGFELRASRKDVEAQQRARLEHQARMVETSLGRSLQATSDALEALRADAPAILARPDGASRLGDRMRAMALSTSGIRSFLLVDATGRSVASSRPDLVGIDFHEGERYRSMSSRPNADRLYLSPPFTTPTGIFALSLGRVLLDGDGRFDGYVLAIVDPDYWNLLLDSTRYAPDMAVAMFHGGGKLIYRVPDPTGAVGTDLSKRPESAFARHVQAGTPQTSWTVPATSTGRESLFVLQTIHPAKSPSDGFLVASFNRDTAAMLAPWREERKARTTLVAVVAAGAFVALFLFQRYRSVRERQEADRASERRAQETARRTLETQLAQSQKLESVGRLAGGVAHDFNNLLTAILAFAEEGLEDQRSGRPVDPACLEEIEGAAHRAADLTRQLLAFARRQVVTPVTLDVNQQVRTSAKLLRRVLGENLRVVEDFQQGPWLVRCDAGLFGQIVLNLAVNARDAMPGGGTLTVKTRNVTVAPGDAVPDPAMVPGDYVRLSVEDTGTGMTPEVLEHLFEPFFTTKGPGKGTGLGLATVYGIVRQSGAFVGVRSAPGQGTAFEIFFPRHDGAVAPSPEVAAHAMGGTETILVVEDEASVRGVVVQALRAAGYRVIAASNADEVMALTSDASGCADLLLTDVVMPGLGGPEVARLVRDRCPGVRVLFMSGYGGEALAGVDERIDLIPKPFTPDGLRTRVREVLDRRPAAVA